MIEASVESHPSTYEGWATRPALFHRGLTRFLKLLVEIVFLLLNRRRENEVKIKQFFKDIQRPLRFPWFHVEY